MERPFTAKNFSLKQLLGVVSVVGLVVGLTTQLYAIGFFLGLYVSVAIVGCLWKRVPFILGYYNRIPVI